MILEGSVRSFETRRVSQKLGTRGISQNSLDYMVQSDVLTLEGPVRSSDTRGVSQKFGVDTKGSARSLA